MSIVGAHLFSWLHGADFYRQMHFDAAKLMAHGSNQTWLDVGCGPGILAHIAADRGYKVRGIDRNPAMIDAARRAACKRRNRAAFEVADIENVCRSGERYDVVSASSLLVVLPDPAAALKQLRALTNPGGKVLVIEAAREMTRMRAFSMVVSGGLGRRAYMLQLWAMLRGGRTLDEAVFDQPGLAVKHYPLLGGLVRASTIDSVPV